ncbi:MAG: glycosyltransferase family 2 protein [Candidatus Omnitrophica bacterium]|nr:glycosyltransferase family 2 protein [Candidatus Omnitrophota bacterium]
MATTVPLSVVIITKNEAARLPACLKSAAWAAERLVVDDESTDGTVAVAEGLGARVLRRKMDIEGRHRNWAYAQATQPWIFSLDADEQFTPELQQEITALLAGAPAVNVYAVPRRNYIGSTWIRHGGWYPSEQVKLFKQGTFQWEEAEVHPRALTEGPWGTLKSDLLHYSYRDFNDFLEKLNGQTRREAVKWHRTGRRVSLGKCLWRATDRFWRSWLLKAGYRDGFVGFMVACFAGWYQLMSYAHYWELTHGTTSNAA